MSRAASLRHCAVLCITLAELFIICFGVCVRVCLCVGRAGKRYRRQDEVGTPFCVTVDHTTLQDSTVTVRDRDSTAQIRVHVDELLLQARGARAKFAFDTAPAASVPQQQQQQQQQ